MWYSVIRDMTSKGSVNNSYGNLNYTVCSTTIFKLFGSIDGFYLNRKIPKIPENKLY